MPILRHQEISADPFRESANRSIFFPEPQSDVFPNQIARKTIVRHDSKARIAIDEARKLTHQFGMEASKVNRCFSDNSCRHDNPNAWNHSY